MFDAPRDDPDAYFAKARQMGYGATVCPLQPGAGDDSCRACEAAAARHDVVIAEVGAWHNNPISPDDATRETSIANCIAALDLADRVGARVCVNVAGSRGDTWAGPHPGNVGRDAFDLIVESVRRIVDSVRPTRAAYALEAMPFTLPDSPESYVELLDAIDRPSMTAVHFDPVNMIHTPRLAYDTVGFLRRCFELLGPRMRSVHAKDIALRGNLTVSLPEVPPGEGMLDYSVFLRELDRLDPDLPVLIEHLPDAAAYARAAAFVRSAADAAGVVLR